MLTLPNLPPYVAHEAYASLCGLLPPPITDTPEARDAIVNGTSPILWAPTNRARWSPCNVS